MKTTTFIVATAMVIAGAAADPDPIWRNWGCFRPGMPCQKVKRAVDAATDILDEQVDTTSSVAKRCFQPGQPCAKAKRAEDALRASLKDSAYANFADLASTPQHHFNEDGKPVTKGYKHIIQRSVPSLLEASDDASADHSFCHTAGQQCDKVKRAAVAISDILSKREAEAEASPIWRNWGCFRPGMPCQKAKREADASPIWRNWGCFRPGMPCQKAKRDLCFRNGQPCNSANRAIDYLDVAASDAVDYVTEDLPGSDYHA